MGVKRGNLILHLTEHKGDVQGYGGVVNHIENVNTYYEELRLKNKEMIEHPKSMPWNSTIFQIVDPFGNRLTFSTPNEYL